MSNSSMGRTMTRKPTCDTGQQRQPATANSPYPVIHPWHKAPSSAPTSVSAHAPMAATAVTLPSSPAPFPVTTTASSSRNVRLLLRSPPPRRALRVAASAAADAPPKPAPPPTSPSGIVLVDPTEAQKVHRLKAVYDQKVVPLITEEFGYTNVHQVFDLCLPSRNYRIDMAISLRNSGNSIVVQ